MRYMHYALSFGAADMVTRVVVSMVLDVCCWTSAAAILNEVGSAIMLGEWTGPDAKATLRAPTAVGRRMAHGHRLCGYDVVFDRRLGLSRRLMLMWRR